jgi:1,2-diacylglycerol-3-alpha-glucose alpha-1,2-glucosyltransferase
MNPHTNTNNTNPPRVCIYLEFFHFFNGILFKKIGTGLLSSYKNQRRILDRLAIPYVERWDNRCAILQVNTPWLYSLWLIRRARKHGRSGKGAKIIIWAHVTLEDAMQVFRFMPYVAPLFKWYLTYAYKQADIILTPTEYTKSLLVAYGIDPKKIEVCSNGVDGTVYHPDPKAREAYRARRGMEGSIVGTVGLVIPRKGVDTFIAISRAVKAQFWWFGKIYSSLLVRPLPKNVSPQVHFDGFFPREDENAVFNAIDIFVFPSYEENQGMVILEAAAVGLPIVVRDIPVYRGWLRDGENCLKAKDDAAFIDAVLRSMSDTTLKNRLCEGARALAKEHDLARICEATLLRYTTLLS